MPRAAQRWLGDERQGWAIARSSLGMSDRLESIEACVPVATVFDLDRLRETCRPRTREGMLGDPDLPRPLLVFVGGDRGSR